MAKKDLDTTGTKAPKFRSVQEIMKQPTLKAKLTNLVDEAVKAKTKIAHEQQNIKVLRDAALEELGLKPALFNQYVGMVFNNDYQQRKENVEQLIDLIDAVLGETSLTHDGE